MKNWSTDVKELSKYPVKYQIFKLESMINFGTDGEKLDGSLLEKMLPILSIDPLKKRYLQMLLS